MMTGGAQARLRPSLIPHFPRDIKDEKRNEGKREEHVNNVKRFAGEEVKCYFAVADMQVFQLYAV
jgi:hypothetical protein